MSSDQQLGVVLRRSAERGTRPLRRRKIMTAIDCIGPFAVKLLTTSLCARSQERVVNPDRVRGPSRGDPSCPNPACFVPRRSHFSVTRLPPVPRCRCLPPLRHSHGCLC